MEEKTFLDTAKESLGTHLQSIEDRMECESPESHLLQDNGEDNLVFGKSMRFGRGKGPFIERLSNFIPLKLLLNIAEGKVNQCRVMLLMNLT